MPEETSAPSKTTCSICSTEMQGTYCHQCGQKQTRKKLKLTSVVEDFLSNIFSLEKSGLATIFLLVTAPVKVIAGYWNGDRRYYEPPSKLIAYAAILIGLHLYFHDNLIFGLQFTDDPKVFFFLSFLVLITISSYVTYFKSKHSFLEHIVANIYLFCAWTITLLVLYEAASYFLGESGILSTGVVLILLFSIMISTARVVGKRKSWLHSVLSSFLQLLAMLVILVVIIGISMQFGDLEVRYD